MKTSFRFLKTDSLIESQIKGVKKGFHPYGENCLLCHCEVVYSHSTRRSEIYHF